MYLCDSFIILNVDLHIHLSSCNVKIQIYFKISNIIKSEPLESQETVASTSQNLTQFVDCEDTIKEDIKEEVEDEYQRDPLRLSNAVQSLDEPVTYEEIICEG